MKNPIKPSDFSERFAKHLFNKGEYNGEVFKVLNHCLTYLNARTIKKVAELENNSVQYTYKKYKNKIVTLLGVKIIIDND